MSVVTRSGGVSGGALSRMAACDIASREHLRVVDGFDFALSHWVRLILAPILPLVIAGILAALLVLFGVLFVPWVDVVGGPLYGVALILGFLLSFVLLGFAVGFPLLIPAVAVEDCDAADAQQRAYAYVLHRPLHLLGYGATAIAGLALGYVVVAFVVATSLNLTGTLTGIVTGSGAAAGAGGFGIFDLSQPVGGALDDTWHAQWSAAFVGFWQRVVIDLVAAYVVSYFFSSSTWIYLLMRQACDGQDIEEVTQD